MKNKLNPNCGIRLRECREAANLTQKQLADAINTTYQSISNIERGERQLTVENARLAARVLGVRMEYLLCEDDIKYEYEYMCINAVKRNRNLKNQRYILGYADGIIEVDDGYIIRQELEGVNDYISCSLEEYNELCKYLEYIVKSWFNERYSECTQEELKIEYQKAAEKYIDKALNEALLYRQGQQIKFPPF